MSLKDRNQKRKIRFLKSQLRFYRSTLIDMTEILSEYESEWLRDRKTILDKFLPDINDSNFSKSATKQSNTQKIVDFTDQTSKENIDDDIEEKTCTRLGKKNYIEK